MLGGGLVVVGGGNSAGQAVVKLADHAGEVHVVARRRLELGMSRYLLDQIEAKSNVRVWSGCEVRALEGDEKLEAVVISGAVPDRRVETAAVFAMIGASPRSEGLVDYVGGTTRALWLPARRRGATRSSPDTGTVRTEAR